MKKIIISALVVAAFGMTSCDDFLNDNRFPLDQQTNNPSYWNNESNVQMQCDQMYPEFTGFATGTGGLFYFQTLTDDQGGGIGNGFTNWKNTNVPASSTAWKSPYEVIRHANSIIEGVETSSLSETAKGKYIGIARMMRAWEYFHLVRAYGDVPYYDHVVDPGNEEDLTMPRTNRDQVMDKVLEDLQYAAANIGNGANKVTYSSDMAKAMLSDIALWEGTFCKYRTQAENGYGPDNNRAQKFLNECVKYSQELMNAGYSLNGSYQANYNSPEYDLNKNPEIIFFRQYKMSVLTHQTIQYLTQTTTIAGISKDAFDAYLFKDGKPKALTSCDNTDAGYVKKGKVDGNIEGDILYIGDLLDVRDQRLAATIDTVVCYGTTANGYTWSRAGSAQLTSNTGYTIKKYDNVNIPYQYRQGSNYTSAPVFWLSVVYLNYAEAKAELGTLTDDDLTASINKLYARAGLPPQTVASLTAMNDPANNMNVSSLIWEIRRCRRCELIMDNDFRYWDLLRWHQLELLDTEKHPDIKLGANIKNANVKLPNQMVGDYLNAIPGNERIYVPRVYTYPIPSGQITLNPNLEQNPLWK